VCVAFFGGVCQLLFGVKLLSWQCLHGFGRVAAVRVLGPLLKLAGMMCGRCVYAHCRAVCKPANCQSAEVCQFGRVCSFWVKCLWLCLGVVLKELKRRPNHIMSRCC
jgi:hypothetical protein